MTTSRFSARPRWLAASLLAALGCWSAAERPPQACAEDITTPDAAVIEEDDLEVGEVVGEVDGRPVGDGDQDAARDPLAPVLAILADNLVLGWKGGRLELDAHALESAFYGPDFAREREAVQATVERIQKLVIDDAVANGLDRDKAEKIFGSIRNQVAPGGGGDVWRMHMHGEEDGLSRYFEEVTPAALLEKACQRTLAQAEKRNLLGDGGGGSSRSSSGAEREWNMRRGMFGFGGKSSAKAGECTISHGARSFKFAFNGEAGLTIRWDTEADDEGRGEETVRLVQTANHFRARHVRDGEVVLTLEGESFRDCCRIEPAVVRGELLPLLRRIGVGPPAMPEDKVVKDEVLARLRRAAGVADPAGGGKAGETLAAAKQRLAQTGAVIEAFGLLDDAAYLADLKQSAAAADVPAIEARLAKLAAAAAKE